ncbi:MAG: helix-turn-helix transcriptional regulator, partial [Clostridia bacterium]|nr:helix-turn-helix transcriptional regulator [Clostridia bacterium]
MFLMRCGMPKKVRRKRIASRGSVNNIILEALNEGDKYGYEIIKQVEEKTNGEIKLKQPSLYSSLGRLEQKGFISSYWGGSDIGGRRHYYYITKEGRHYYNTVILKLEVQQSDEDIEALEKAAPYYDFYRPVMVSLKNCDKILIEDVSLRNSPAWNVHPHFCT